MLVTVENGVAVKIEGAPDHPTTQGVLCTKVARYLERTYSPDRLLYPMQRVGRKGEGKFTRISWDDALATITSRLQEIARDDPQAILPYSYCGTMGYVQSSSMDRRFFHRLGASLLDRTICSTAGGVGYKATIGASIGTDMEQFQNAKLILIWGSNPIVSNLHLWTRVQEAKRRGAKLIAIDPWRSQTAEKCQQHLQLLPGSDGALALAMMHVLINEDLLDHDYIDKYTLGFEQLKARGAAISSCARGADYRPQRGSHCHPRARVRRASLPSSASNYELQRHAGGGMAVRNIGCLPAPLALGATRRRRAASLPAPTASTPGAGAARPHLECAAHNQHVRHRRCAARDTRPADPRHRGL
jgi:anaerobic selenocysteine-containing dehydrogenase